MICSLLKLLKKNIPGLLLWEHKGQLRYIGSTAMSKWFEELDDEKKKNCQEKMVEDSINISENKLLKRKPVNDIQEQDIQYQISSILKRAEKTNRYGNICGTEKKSKKGAT